MDTASTISHRAQAWQGHVRTRGIAARETQGASPVRPLCFLTSRRLLCGETDCPFRRECRRLIAAWRR